MRRPVKKKKRLFTWGNLPAQVPHLDGYLTMKAYFASTPFCVSYFCASLVEKKMLLPETKSLRNILFFLLLFPNHFKKYI